MQDFSVANMPANIVANNSHHGRELIREVRAPFDADPSEIYRLHHIIGAPKKITPKITRRIDQLTAANREMPSEAITRIISETLGMPKISSSSVDTVRHQLGYKFRPAITAFPLNNDQTENWFVFAGAHNATDWSKTMFTSESSFILSAPGWVWRRKAETGTEIYWMKGMFPPKVMVFAGISRDYKSALTIAESGTIHAESYVTFTTSRGGLR
jgi:hypothetical protein